MRRTTSISDCFLPAPRGATMLTMAAVLGMVILPELAQASFVGPYQLSNFSLLNTNADGSWTSPDGDQTLVLTGGNNGSGLEGFTHFLLNAPQTVQISFDFLWTTDDSAPEFDIGGYFLQGFQPLTELQTAGSRSFLVQQGQGFGFSVRTLDNMGGPGSLTISNFQAAAANAAIPEPSTAVPILLLTGGYLLRKCRRSVKRQPQRLV